MVTEEDLLSDHMDKIPINERTIDDMVNIAKFQVNEPIIRTSNQNAKTTISLSLRLVPAIQLPISGFPRQLRKEDEVTRRSCQCTPLKRKFDQSND